MKKLMLLPLVLLSLAQATCKKEKREPQLPPETQTGAYTFGCKVNGKVFVPQDGRGKPGLYAQYVNLGEGPNGGWFLNIVAVDQVPVNSIGVNLVTDSLFLEQGKVYQFKNEKGYPKIRYYIGLDSYLIANNDSGQLTISKHDKDQRILSGSFWFKATNQSGDKVDITDGRFDIVY